MDTNTNPGALDATRAPTPAPELNAELEAFHAFQEGSRLLHAAQPAAAVTLLERARDLEPGKGSVREALARAYFQCGQFAAARGEFEHAVEIDPTNDYAHFGLGLSLLRAGERDAARGHLRLAVAMRPLEDYRRALATATREL